MCPESPNKIAIPETTTAAVRKIQNPVGLSTAVVFPLIVSRHRRDLKNGSV